MRESWFLVFADSPQALFQALEPTRASACTLFVLANRLNSRLRPLDNYIDLLRGCDQREKYLGFVLSQGNLGFQVSTLFCRRTRALSGDFARAFSLLSRGACGSYPELCQ